MVKDSFGNILCYPTSKVLGVDLIAQIDDIKMIIMFEDMNKDKEKCSNKERHHLYLLFKETEGYDLNINIFALLIFILELNFSIIKLNKEIKLQFFLF